MTRNRWIEFDGKRYHLSEGQTALDAMLRGGADLFFSCRRGTCRSCMLEAVSGDPGAAAQARLPEELRKIGFFLPCVADSPESVVAVLPDLSKWVSKAEIAEITPLSGSIYKILLETERRIEWRAGQFISIRNPEGDVRSYSITSLPEDYFIEIHMRHYPGGKVSDWLITHAGPRGAIEFNGPVGTCYYSRDVEDKPLVFVATGTGGGALLGVARDALKQGHKKNIKFYHGSATESGLYLREGLAQLEADHPNFKSFSVASQEGEKTRATDLMLVQNPDLSAAAVFLCGNPDAVEAGRVGALRNGVSLDNIYADPFNSQTVYQPRDSKKVKSFKPDPEMWEALDNGRVLKALLTEFYTRAFEDAQLAPFFHKVTKQRLIEKQYAFTRDLLAGTADYFGELPFNSHHWMIISDELFNHRERLFFTVVREFGIAEKYIRRWAALNEMFRREIVKSSARGQMLDGVEHYREGTVREVMQVDTLCDGCAAEIRTGDTALLHERTGELFCAACSDG